MRKPRAIAGLAVLLTGAWGFLWWLSGGSWTRSPGRFVRLPLPHGDYRQTRGVTRPSVVLESGRFVEWIIPPGPRREFEASFLVESGTRPESEGRLAAALTHAAPPGRTLLEETRRVRGPIGPAPEWQSWRFTVPSIRREAKLRIGYGSAHGNAWTPPVTLAQPILSTPSRRPGKLVLLVVVDTLRRDHLSAYGYKLPTTPEIDRFFSRGLVWDRCFANSCWTLASHATIFTSTPPMEHGLGEERLKLPAELPTLAETFASAGYRTLAVTGGGYVDPTFGFGRGFDVYVATDDGVDAETSRALEMLDESRGAPVFLFFHTYQVHEYKATPEAARQLFGAASGAGKSWLAPISSIFRFGWEPDFERKVLVNRYDAALRSVDDSFGRLLAGLRHRGLLDEAAIYLTSDHGEEIMDRPLPPQGGYLVGHIHPFLHEEYLAVPLMARLPGSAPRRLASDVSLLDVAPTILGAAGIPAPRTFEGRNLLSARSAPGAGEEAVVSKAPRFDALAVRSGRHKLISRPGFPLSSWEDGTSFGTPPAEECFDLGRDPGEKTPVACADDWGRELHRLRDRAIATSLEGSLVLRFPTRWAGRAFGVRAASNDGAPGVTAFGEDPLARFDVGKDLASARLSVGGSGTWVAIKPGQGGGDLRIELYGVATGEIRSPGSRQRRLTGEWLPAGEALWRGEDLPEDGIAVMAMPSARVNGRSQLEQIEPEALVRLRSLGYLSSGAFAVKGTGPGSGPPARFRLDVYPSLSDSRAPGEERAAKPDSLLSAGH